MREIKEYLEKCCEAVEDTLDEILPKETEYPQTIHKLMRYSTFAGGKRIRPVLVFAANEACGGQFANKDVRLAGCAVEMLHTFSLIHDDLPCMDDDDLRRGRPTAHKVFGEGIAVLGGDALAIFAYEIMARTGNIKIIEEISKALGTNGMIGGQIVDIESEGKKVDLKTIEYIHNNKTAALLCASVIIGASLANADSRTLAALSEYGNAVGLAFQVIDDILDITSTTQELGKEVGSDVENEKATYPSIIGLEKSKEYAKELTAKAKKSIAFLGEKADMLNKIADYLESRIN
ncbi:MAG: polyprenyl synthetase family protein [Chitinispirillales bacterium]|jgi:geranylgeranyl diphosphate synthase type II|nr:polyprenyl synthetase family protein [Chitinispirillales bacterium]